MYSYGCVCGCTFCCVRAHADAEIHAYEDVHAEEHARTDVREYVEIDADTAVGADEDQTCMVAHMQRNMKENHGCRCRS